MMQSSHRTLKVPVAVSVFGFYSQRVAENGVEVSSRGEILNRIIFFLCILLLAPFIKKAIC